LLLGFFDIFFRRGGGGFRRGYRGGFGRIDIGFRRGYRGGGFRIGGDDGYRGGGFRRGGLDIRLGGDGIYRGGLDILLFFFDVIVFVVSVKLCGLYLYGSYWCDCYFYGGENLMR
ncbi:unnamed protein product, partial [Rotaria sp. Silwood2]